MPSDKVSESSRNRAPDAIADMIDANVKRTYDVMQSVDLAREQLCHEHTARLHILAEQALANAINCTNLANLQAIAHRDIAIDSTWVPGPGEENIKDD
jgi:predicted negative regulator of RcsB-dependent stress response